MSSSVAVSDRTRFRETRRGDLVKRFLVAYRRGLKDFVHAFVASDGKRQDGPTAAAIMEILSKFTGVPPAAIEKASRS